MTPSGMGIPRGPMPRRGDPESNVCRWCGSQKLMIKGEARMCETCDAPQVDGITIRPTWKPRFA